MNHRTARKIMMGMTIGGVITANFATIFLSTKYFFIILGGIIAFSGILLGIIFVRCPYCKCQLPLSGFSPNHCPNCGKRI